MVVVLVLFFYACTNNNGGTNSLSSIDSNTANDASAIQTDKILIQGFTQVPSIINNCSALFVKDTTNGTAEYYFVTNLKGTAFIKLNNRLMELRLIKQTNIDKYTVNELYEVRMFDWNEKQVIYQKKMWGEVDGNIISYSYMPQFSEFHMIKPVQVNKQRKKNLCGYVMLLKRTKPQS